MNFKFETSNTFSIYVVDEMRDLEKFEDFFVSMN